MTISHHDHDPETPVTPAPLSAYVDYTPRRTFVASKPDKGFHQLDGCSRQRRAFYFHQLAQQENDTDDYMDSPAVRRYHGVNVEVAPIEPDIEHTQSSLDRLCTCIATGALRCMQSLADFIAAERKNGAQKISMWANISAPVGLEVSI